jgi:choline-sulfatase
MDLNKPNVLFIMTDQQRFDTIRALGGRIAPTPNLDSLAHDGVAFSAAYSPCPVCVPARYTIRSGRDTPATGWLSNTVPAQNVEQRTGDYIARRMGRLGYRTWGIGKFHAQPWEEDLGFERILHCEENLTTAGDFERDDYVKWLRTAHPDFAHLEQVHGERTDMYYAPQTRAQPAGATAEYWVSGKAVEELACEDRRPFFGFVSFIQPHPPIAPPVPYNRMFNPDEMPGPVVGPEAIDTADPYLAWMNYLVWADDISDSAARQLKARYYGEIAFLDVCIGRILDALRRRPGWRNTLVVFFSDHGEMLGDHRAWQKESYFEASCRIPFIVSWPAKLAGGQVTNALASLTDLYGMATRAAGACDVRDGHDVLGALLGECPPRPALFGVYGPPGKHDFKAMMRQGDWKYIWIANGGRELLFNVRDDPGETILHNEKSPALLAEMRKSLEKYLSGQKYDAALGPDGTLKALDYCPAKRCRILQFERGVANFTSTGVQLPANVERVGKKQLATS